MKDGHNLDERDMQRVSEVEEDEEFRVSLYVSCEDCRDVFSFEVIQHEEEEDKMNRRLTDRLTE